MRRAAVGSRVRARRERAFTLIELLVVSVILAGGLTLAVWKLDGLLPRTRLQSTARMIGRTAASLRTHALSIGETLYLEYDLTEGRLRARREVASEEDDPDDPALEIYGWKPIPEGIRIQDVAFSKSYAVETGLVTIPFEPNGTTVHHMVHLELPDLDRKFTVEVTPLLGRVRFAEEWKEFEFVQDEDFP